METLRFVLAHELAQLPTRAHPDDAGLDLKSAEHVVIGPGEFLTVGTGVSVELPTGTAGLIHPRSGLAARCGVTVLNAPGTIDAGYTGQIGVILVNHGTEAFEVHPGDRIAQLVVVPVLLPAPVRADSVAESARGGGGFGSTGA